MLNPVFFFVVLFLSALVVNGQEDGRLYKGRKVPLKPIMEIRDTVGINPFKLADRVELLYYTSNRMQWREGAKRSYPQVLDQGGIAIPTDSIAKRIILDADRIAEWNVALYEMQLCEELRVAGCYEPRHLLVFYDKGKKVLGAIEICISCAGGWASPGLRKVVFCPERTGVLAAMISRG